MLVRGRVVLIVVVGEFAELAVFKGGGEVVIVLDRWVEYLQNIFFLGILNTLIKLKFFKINILLVEFLIYSRRMYLVARKHECW